MALRLRNRHGVYLAGSPECRYLVPCLKLQLQPGQEASAAVAHGPVVDQVVEALVGLGFTDKAAPESRSAASLAESISSCRRVTTTGS